MAQQKQKEYADLSKAERMTLQAKKREEVVRELRKNPDALKPKPKPTAISMGVRRQDGVFETPDLSAARQAEEKRRAELKNPAPEKPAPAELEAQDQIAIFNAFVARTPEFALTAWNLEMFHRAVVYYMATGDITYSSSGMDAIYETLDAGGFLETKIRTRGQAAPKEFPNYTPQPKPDTNNSNAVRVPLTQKATQQIISQEEAERLRTMPLADLRELARKDWNRNRWGEAVR